VTADDGHPDVVVLRRQGGGIHEGDWAAYAGRPCALHPYPPCPLLLPRPFPCTLPAARSRLPCTLPAAIPPSRRLAPPRRLSPPPTPPRLALSLHRRCPRPKWPPLSHPPPPPRPVPPSPPRHLRRRTAGDASAVAERPCGSPLRARLQAAAAAPRHLLSSAAAVASTRVRRTRPLPMRSTRAVVARLRLQGGSHRRRLRAYRQRCRRHRHRHRLHHRPQPCSV